MEPTQNQIVIDSPERLPILSGKYEIEDVHSDSIAEIAKLLTRGPVETLEHLEQVSKIEDKDTLRSNATHMAEMLGAEAESLRQIIEKRLAGLPPEEQARERKILDAIDHEKEKEKEKDVEITLAELGLSFEYAWMNDVVATMLTGSKPVEIETVGPYAAAHINPESDKLEIDIAKIPPDEMAGILVAAILRKIDPVAHNTRIVSLIDELNNFMSDRHLSKDEQDAYVAAMVEFYGQAGVLKPDDVPGEDFIILRESDLAQKVGELEAKLASTGKGKVVKNDRGETLFMPTEELVDSLALHTGKTVKELKTKGVLLRRADGTPTCPAMDAAGFLNPINEKYMHVVMLDVDMETQQDKTYALLKALGTVKQERYHNILFDSEGLSPEMVAYGVTKTIEKHTKTFIAALDKYDEWEAFDPYEYVERNYGDKILPEDDEIMTAVITGLKNLGIQLGSIHQVADIGSGPNLYPSMLMAPYLSNEARIEMLEFSPSNRKYMLDLLEGTLPEEHADTWHKFEERMKLIGGEMYQGSEERAKRAAEVKPGNIFELEKGKYDLISSYFVAESIVDSQLPFREAVQSVADALTPDGVMIIAHMVGSEGYHAGFKEGEKDENGEQAKINFPAVNLTIKDLEETYADADLEFEIIPVGEDVQEKARDGYHGMAVVIARRKDRNRS